MNTITLYRTGTGWVALFAGPAAKEVIDVMGTDTLPTGFTAQAESPDVRALMVRNWPQFEVRVHGVQA